jgi:Phage integrase, N-terminal SAM-like domain
MSPLRERMIEDMTLAGLALGTRQAYTQAVRRLTARYRRSPDQLNEEEVRGYLLELRQQGAARGTFKIGLYGLRFFYQRTLHRDWDLFREKKDRRTWAEAAASCAVGRSGPSTARPRPQHDPPDVPRHHVCVRPAHRRSHPVGDPLRRPRQPGAAYHWQRRQGAAGAAAPAGSRRVRYRVADPSQPALAVPQPVRGRAAQPTRAIAYLRRRG